MGETALGVAGSVRRSEGMFSKPITDAEFVSSPTYVYSE